MIIALRLAKSGWWGGDPEKVLKAPADLVMSAIQYLNFTEEYEGAFLKLNKTEAE